MGDARTSPPEIGKIDVEIWCYHPEVYTFGAETELQEIFIRKLSKSTFSIEILIKKFQNFLEPSFVVQTRKVFAGMLISLTCPIEIIHES